MKRIDRWESEHAMVVQVVQLLRPTHESIKLEVPNMGQSIDIVCLSGKDVLAVEAKLSNWKRALQQCKAHEHVADYLVIALDERVVNPVIERECEELGYGLITCDAQAHKCEFRMRPKRNESVWLPQREHFTLNMAKID